MSLTAAKLQRILILRIKYKVPLEFQLTTKNSHKELLTRLDQIIDWFLDYYPDLENEPIVLNGKNDLQTITKFYDCSKTKQIVFVILDYFLKQLSWEQQRRRNLRQQQTCFQSIALDHNNDDFLSSSNDFVLLAKHCRNLNDREQISKLTQQLAKNLLKLTKPRRQLIIYLVELSGFWSEDDSNVCNSKRIERAASFLSPYIMQLVLPPPLPPQLFPIFNEHSSTETITEPVFLSLTIFLIYCWPEVRLHMGKTQSIINSNSSHKNSDSSMLKSTAVTNYYNSRTQKMLQNSSTQTSSALVEPQSFYRINTCDAFQKARNDLEIRFQPKHLI